MLRSELFCLFFFFNDTATTEIYTLSLHDALPIWPGRLRRHDRRLPGQLVQLPAIIDRKSTRLNSSHTIISYAVFSLKKKKKTNDCPPPPIPQPFPTSPSTRDHAPAG